MQKIFVITSRLVTISCFILVVMTGEITAASEASKAFFKLHPNEIDLQQEEKDIYFANRQTGIVLQQVAGGFQLVEMYGIEQEQGFLTDGHQDLFEIIMTLDPKRIGRDDRQETRTNLRQIMQEMAGDAFAIGSNAASTSHWRQEQTQEGLVLYLIFKGMDVREEKGVLDVTVTIRLREGDPLSYWRITVQNRSSQYGIERVRFPLVTLAPIGHPKDNSLLLPVWRGCLIEDPFHQPLGFGEDYHRNGVIYPASFNMQFQALYNHKSNNGVYLGTRDPVPHLMNIQIVNTPEHIQWRPGHFPPNIGFASEDFALAYDCVLGPFRGDWFDACQIYRQWALQQSWCQKGPLATRQDIPRWYKEAPLYFYTTLSDSATGTHSVDENLHLAAEHFRKFLHWTGVQLPINWYTWDVFDPARSSYSVPFNAYRLSSRGRWAGLPGTNAHDGNYPKIPALSEFSSVCKSLREDGGMVCPYVALQLFDQGASENSPYAKEAGPHIIRDHFGARYTWPSEYVWVPCTWSSWWRDRLKQTCVTLLDQENVGGFYLDVMHGRSKPCYWTPHGHTAAGGSSMTVGMHNLVEYLHDAIKANDPDAIATGENSSENMIDVIDGILYQRTIRPENTAPIFAAVYQDYIPRYGVEISVGSGDPFFMDCASMFVEGAQIGRFRIRPRSHILSFEDPEHEPLLAFLEQLVGYYKQEETKRYLAYGQLMRPLRFVAPSPMPQLSYKVGGGYTYKGGFLELPALMSGVFQSKDGSLGIFVVNASSMDLDFRSQLDPAQYKIVKNGPVEVRSIAPDGTFRRVLSATEGILTLSGSLASHQATMFQVRPATR